MIKAFLTRTKERWRFLKPVWAAYRVVLGALPWRWVPGTSRWLGPPRGFHLGTAGYLAGGGADPRDRVTEVAPAGVLEFAPPRGIDPETHWKFRQYARQEIPAVRVYELHGVRFWGDYAGTLIGRDDRVLGDLTTDVWELRRHRVFTRLKLPRCRPLRGTTAILSVAEAESNYWHWTMDVLPRLDLIRRGGVALAAIDWFVVNHRDRPFQRETLEELGVPWEKVVRADAGLHVECERVVTTSLKSHQYAVTPADCALLNGRAARQWPDARPHRRIYVSRQGTLFRHLTNEPAVLAVLAPMGFEVVRCETLSVAEQRRVFREAAVIVGPHGSGFTNAVYGQPGTRLLEFMAPRYVDLAFWAGAVAVGVEPWVLFGEGPHPAEGVDPMARQQDITVDLGRLRETLAAMGLG